VISNAGFELISEALQLGKRIMVKPLLGQPEQRSNALALQQLGLAFAQNQLSSQCIVQFLTEYQPTQSVRYPDVAAAIAQWLVKGYWYDHAALQQLWQKVLFQQKDVRADLPDARRAQTTMGLT
jgi:predicted glycosyltransferase